MNAPRLTPAERRIAELLLCAHPLAAIARTLHLADDTIKHHLTNMYRKFGVCQRGSYAPRIRLAMLIHNQHEALGVRCETCEHLKYLARVRRVNLPYAKLVEQNALTPFTRP